MAAGCPSSAVTDYYFNLSSTVQGAKKGEGIALYSSTKNAGRGAQTNGGGGGNNHNSSGAGGGNYGTGGIGSNTFNGCGLYTVNAAGGYGLTYSNSVNKVFMGGGGGAPHENDSHGTPGQNGAGIILISANGILSSNDTIKADGASVTAVSTNDGSGGGGGGGTILLNARVINTVNVSAVGGKGGDNNTSAYTGYCVGPGGGGGGGVLWMPTASSKVKINLAGGQAGIIQNTGMTCSRTHYGADSGTSGGVVTGLSLPSKGTVYNRPKIYAGKDVTICLGDSAHLSASGGIKYAWLTGTSSLSDSTIASPWAYPVTTTQYVVRGYDSKGCSVNDTVVVTVDTSFSKCGKYTKIGGVINNYAQVLSLDTCMNSATVDSTTGFKAGSELMIIQMQGATIDSSNTSSFGSIKNYNGAGNYEFLTVDSVSGKTIYFKNKPSRTYSASGNVQLITYPKYTGDVIVTKKLTAQPWNGSKGGVLVFSATGQVIMLADIDASGKGFRGAAVKNITVTCPSSAVTDYYFNWSTTNQGAKKGEGIALYLSTKNAGRGAQTNGGGGGNNHNAGGGGGSNYGAGGKGSMTYNGCQYSVNAAGGYALTYDNSTNRIYLGGGGGAGHENDNVGTAGQNGGGIIVINAGGIQNSTGTIKSDGISVPTTAGNDGAGGGGAGGTILLNIPKYINSLNVSAVGGKGGDNNAAGNPQCVGTGGGGGGGLVWLSSSSKKVTSNIIGGQAGNIVNTNSPCYPGHYGSDTGVRGAVLTGLSLPAKSSASYSRPTAKAIKSPLICKGDSVKLYVSGGVKWAWWPKKAMRDSTLQSPYVSPDTTTIYHVRAYTSSGCYAEDTVTVRVVPKPTIPVPNLLCVSTFTLVCCASGCSCTLPDTPKLSVINLHWTYSLPNSNLGGYNIYRSKNDQSHFVEIASLSTVKVQTYNDTVSVNDTNIYYYKVTAYSYCGSETKAGIVLDNSVLHVKKLSDKTVQLRWNRPMNADARKKARIYYYINGILHLQDSTSNTTYNFSRCSFNGQFLVYIPDSSGSCDIYTNTSTSVKLKSIISPAPPKVLNVSTINYGQINITYRTSDSADVVKHLLYRATDNGAYTLQNSIQFTQPGNQYTYIDYNVSADKHTYSYKLIAVDSCGLTDTSNYHTQVLLTGKPGNLAAKLKWTRYYGFASDSVRVQKLQLGKWKTIAFLAGTDTSYTDTVVKCYSPSYYRIVTLDKSGSGLLSYSDTIKVQPFDTIKPPAIVPDGICNGNDYGNTCDVNGVTIYWSYLSSTFKTNVKYLKTVRMRFKHWFSSTWDSLDVPAGNFGKTTSICGVDYYALLQLVAIDSCGNQSQSVVFSYPRMTMTPLQKAVKVQWATPMGFEGRVKSYTLYLYGGSSGHTKTIKNISPTDTTYLDTGLKCTDVVYYGLETQLTDGGTICQEYTTTVSPNDTTKPKPLQFAGMCWGTNALSPNRKTLNVYYDNTKLKNIKTVSFEYRLGADSGWHRVPVAVVDVTTKTSYPYLSTNKLSTINKDSLQVRLVETDSCGNTVISNPVYMFPALRAKAGNAEADLSWTSAHGNGIKNYTLYRYGMSKADSKTFTITDLADTTLVDSNRLCKDSLHYELVTNLTNGGVICADTIQYVVPFDTIGPGTVNVLSTSVLSGNKIQIQFQRSPDTLVHRYIIYASKNKGAYSAIDTFKSRTSAPVYTFNYNVNTLTDTFAFRVYAQDTCGNYSKQTEVHRAMQLNGKAEDDTDLLSWSAYRGFSVKNYVVQLWNNGWSDYRALSATDTSFLDTAGCYKTYYYRIKTIENGGDNAIAYSDSIKLQPFDTIRPAEPSITAVTVLSGTQLQISWTKSSRDVKNYNLYRANRVGSWVKIASLGNVLTYTDTGVTARQSYCYSVQAQDSCKGNLSSLSKPHCSMLLLANLHGCERTNYLNWSAYSGWDSVTKYELYRSVNGSSETLLKTLSKSAATYQDTGLDYHKNYCYRIKAYDSHGDVSWSDKVCQSIYFVDTANVITATKTVTDSLHGKIVVRWKDIKAKRYMSYTRLYTSTDGQHYNLLNTLSAGQDSFVVNDVNTRKGEFYYYTINYDSCGTRSDSSSIHKTMDLEVSVGQLVHKLNWTSYKGFAVRTYRIERVEGGKWQKIDSVPGTDTFSRQFPAPCHYTIQYRIAAVGSQPGQISYSDTMGRVAIDTQPSNRAIISNLTVVNGHTTQLTFRGSDSLDTYAYYIQREEGGSWGTAGQLLFSGPGSSDIYTDKADAYDSTLSYTVITLDSCLNATMTDTFSAIQLTGKPQNLSDSIRWYPFKGYGIQTYYILTYNSTKANWDTLASVTGTDTQYYHQPLQCDVSVTYRIEGYEKAGGRVTYSDSITLTPYDTIRPPKPTLQYATVLSGNDKVTLYWDKSIPKVKLYELWMRTGHGSWKLNTSVINQTSYTFSGLNTVDSVYQFSIVAVDSCAANRSPNSDYHSPVKLGGKGQNLSNLLSWKKYEGFAGVKQYNIYKWNAGWNLLATLSSADTSYLDTGLSCNVPRSYKIGTIDNASMYESFSDSISLTPFDTIKPPKPDIQYSTVLSGNSSITLYWNRSVSKVKQYELWMRSGHGSWALNTVVNNATSYTFSGLNAHDSAYQFRIVAVDSCAANRSPYSDYHSPVLLGGKGQNLANLLTWKKYEGFAGVKQYNVYEWLGGWKALATVSGSDTSYVHDSLVCNMPHYYRVGTVDNNSLYESYSDSISLTPFDTIKPVAPELYYASVQPDRSVKIGWQWDRSTVIKYFEIWRSTNSGAASRIATVTYDSTYIDNTADPKTNKYAYYVIAIDSCNTADRSRPSDTDTMMNLKLATGGCTPVIKLSWTRYQELQGGTDKYIVYRADTSIGPFVKLDSAKGNTTSYVDNTVLPNKHYYYKIEATGSNTEYSSFSDSIGIVPWIYPHPDTLRMTYTSVTATGNNSGKIYLQWQRTAITDTFARGYHIYHKDGSGNYVLIHDEKDIKVTTYTDKNLNTLSALNDYYLAAYNLCGIEGPRSKVHQPVLLQAKNEDLRITVSWSSYVGQGVKQYKLYRSHDGSNYILLPTKAGDTTYVDTGIYCGHHYTYQVQALLTNKDTSWSDSTGVDGFDTIRPAIPLLQFVSVDTTDAKFGTMSIGWYGNSKANRRGYKLFRSVNGSAYKLRAVLYNTKVDSLLYYKDQNLDTKDSTYAYYLTAIDTCGNESKISDKHQHVHVRVKTFSRHMQVNWTAYKGWEDWKYVLEKKKPGGGWYVMDTFDNSTTYFSDSDVSCHKYYEYHIRSLDNDSAWISFSNVAGDTAYDTIKPIISQIKRATVTITSKNKGRNLLEWNASTSKDISGYNIYRSDEDKNNWRLIGIHYKDTSYTDSLLNTYGQSYSYKIQAIDSCGNLSEFQSITHRSIHLKVFGGNQQVSMMWNGYQGWHVKKYLVYRNGVLYDSVSGSANGYADTMTICNDMYQYKVVAVCDSSLYLVSESNTDSTRAYDNKPPQRVYVKYVTVHDQHNRVAYLEWAPSPSYDTRIYYVYRKGADDRLKLIDSTTNTFCYDSSRTIKTPDCYFVFAVDHCGNMSAGSNAACLMILSGLDNPGSNSMVWNSYREWPDGVNYYNVNKQEDSVFWNYCGTTKADVQSFTDNKLADNIINYCYQVEAVEKPGEYNAKSKSTIICIHQPPIVYIPNIFSPYNKDNLNDLFGPKGMYIRNYDMKIYNRWGENVYGTSEGKGWDGYFHGQLVPEGVYIYYVTVYGYNGEKQTLKGNVTILTQ
jgi:gliding motility-associated-like protein